MTPIQVARTLDLAAKLDQYPTFDYNVSNPKHCAIGHFGPDVGFRRGAVGELTGPRLVEFFGVPAELFCYPSDEDRLSPHELRWKVRRHVAESFNGNLAWNWAQVTPQIHAQILRSWVTKQLAPDRPIAPRLLPVVLA